MSRGALKPNAKKKKQVQSSVIISHLCKCTIFAFLPFPVETYAQFDRARPARRTCARHHVYRVHSTPSDVPHHSRSFAQPHSCDSVSEVQFTANPRTDFRHGAFPDIHIAQLCDLCMPHARQILISCAVGLETYAMPRHGTGRHVSDSARNSPS